MSPKGDKAMLIKFGVDISRLNREIRRMLPAIDNIYRQETDTEAVITSTYEGTHSTNSLHYCNDAIDLRLPRSNQSGVVDALEMQTGKGFDVVEEQTHIHIEYDPKK